MKHFFLGAALAVASLVTTAAHASTLKLEATGTVSDITYYDFASSPLVPDPIVGSGADVQLSVMIDLNSLSEWDPGTNGPIVYSYRLDVLANVRFSNANGSASFDMDDDSRLTINKRFSTISFGFNDLDAPASAFGFDDGRTGLSFFFAGLDPSKLSTVPDLETLQEAVASTSPDSTATFQFLAYEFDADGEISTVLGAAYVDLDLSTFTVTAVPLPAAGWMLIAGVGGLAAMRRRSKAA